MDTNPTIPAGARHLYDTAMPQGASLTREAVILLGELDVTDGG
jgi:hypothetical protein